MSDDDIQNAMDVANTVAYHGTPHTFAPQPDAPLGKFDLSKLGTGEGAQAYGHGIYVAESLDVARQYRRSLTSISGGPATWKNKFENDSIATNVDNNLSTAKRLRVLAASDTDTRVAAMRLSYAEKLEREANELDAKGPGAVYHVAIPKKHIDRMLDWDAPLSDQSSHVKNALSDMKLPAVARGDQIYDALKNRAMSSLEPSHRGSLESYAPLASRELNNRGIHGIKYLDEGSRGRGEDTVYHLDLGNGDTSTAYTSRDEANEFLGKYKAGAFPHAKLVASHKPRTRNFVIFDPDIAKIVKKGMASGGAIDDAVHGIVTGVSPGFGETANPVFKRASGLTAAQRGMEKRFYGQISGNFDSVRSRYNQLPDARGGKVLNTDTARELSPDYLADRTQSAAVHEPASHVIKRLYAEKLKEAPRPGEESKVLWTGGGTGAGKSTAVKGVLGPIEDRAQIVYDTNLSDAGKTKQKIDAALAHGKENHVAYVYRDPVTALVKGALPRAMGQAAKHGSGRTVPIEEHVKTHVESNKAIRELMTHYKNDTRVHFQLIDNNGERGTARAMSVDELPHLDYNSTRERVTKALEREYAAGRISPEIYRGFAGTKGVGLGAGNHQQPEPQRAGERSDVVKAAFASGGPTRLHRADGGGVETPETPSVPSTKFHVGPIHSGVSGRTDHLPMTVESGSYVLPADIVSAGGEGNTLAGFRVLRRTFGGAPYGVSAPYGQKGGVYGLPVTYAAGGKVRASGVMFLSPEKQVLLLRRAGENHKGEWAFPAGHIEKGETPERAARRETQEEAGYDHDGGLSPFMHSDSQGVEFTTYLAHSQRFTPKLNEEHDGAMWVDPEAAQRDLPLHPGVKAALAKLGSRRVEKAGGGEASGVPIVAAGGEHVLSPDQVRRVGNGDLDTGHRVLDAFVKRVRKELIGTLSKLPGPRRD